MAFIQPLDRPELRQPFHTLHEEDLFAILGTSREGLSTLQAAAALARYGHNDISQIRRSPVIFRILALFKIPADAPCPDPLEQPALRYFRVNYSFG